MVVILQYATITHSTVMCPLLQSVGVRENPNDNVFSHLGLDHAALGTRGCRRRGNV